MKRPIDEMSKEEILEKLLEKELKYYQGILEITEQEQQLLSSIDGLTAISKLTKQKGILFSCIQEIEEALTPLKKWWQTLDQKKTPERERVTLGFRRIDGMLKQILDLDQTNQRLVKERMASLKQKASSTSSV